MKYWVYDCLVHFLGAADGLLCAKGRPTSRCVCSGGPVSWESWIQPVKHTTARLTFAWLASVSGICHVELDKLLNSTKEKKKLPEYFLS